MNIYKNFHSPSQEWLLCNISLRHQHMVKQKGDQKNDFQRRCLISLSQNYEKKKKKKLIQTFKGERKIRGLEVLLGSYQLLRVYLVCLIWAFKALKNYVFITYELVLSLRFLPLRKELCIACFTSELRMRVTDIFTGFDLQRVSIWIR